MIPTVLDLQQVSSMDEDQYMEVKAVMEIRVVALVDDDLALIYHLLFEPIEIVRIASCFFLLPTNILRNMYMIEEMSK
jgi:hypothetical protein